MRDQYITAPLLYVFSLRALPPNVHTYDHQYVRPNCRIHIKYALQRGRRPLCTSHIIHESPFVYERKSSIAVRERPDDQWSAGLDTAVLGRMLHPLQVCFLLFDDSVSSLFIPYQKMAKISLSFAMQ